MNQAAVFWLTMHFGFYEITGQFWEGLLHRHDFHYLFKWQWLGTMRMTGRHWLLGSALHTSESLCDPCGSLAPEPARSSTGSCSDLGAIKSNQKHEQTLHITGGEAYLLAFNATGTSGPSSTTKGKCWTQACVILVSSANIRGIFHLNPPMHPPDGE